MGSTEGVGVGNSIGQRTFDMSVMIQPELQAEWCETFHKKKRKTFRQKRDEGRNKKNKLTLDFYLLSCVKESLRING